MNYFIFSCILKMQLFLSFFMGSSEVEKLFRAFAEERKRALPQFTPDGIPITLENKFDDAIYNYLYKYWKTNSGEYDPKDDEIIMTKENSFTKNEKKFEQWLLQQYGMTKKEEREYTVKGNLLSLGEIAEGYFTITGIGAIKKGIAYLAANKISKETLLKAFLGQTDDMVRNVAKKEAISIPSKKISFGSNNVTYESIIRALRQSNSKEGYAVVALLKCGKVKLKIEHIHPRGYGGLYRFGTNTVTIYTSVAKTPLSAAGYTAHEVKHFLQNLTQAKYAKIHEFEAFIWQRNVDKTFQLRLEQEIWNILNTHPAYKYLKPY